MKNAGQSRDLHLILPQAEHGKINLVWEHVLPLTQTPQILAQCRALM